MKRMHFYKICITFFALIKTYGWLAEIGEKGKWGNKVIERASRWQRNAICFPALMCYNPPVNQM